MIKKIILQTIYALSGLLMLLTGLFSISSYGIESVNAFSIMAFGDAFCIVVGAVAILIMAGGLAVMIMLWLSIYKGKETLLKLVPFIACVASFVYLILAIACVDGMVSSVFVPFILQFVLLIAYVVVTKLLPESQSEVECSDAE